MSADRTSSRSLAARPAGYTTTRDLTQRPPPPGRPDCPARSATWSPSPTTRPAIII